VNWSLLFGTFVFRNFSGANIILLNDWDVRVICLGSNLGSDLGSDLGSNLGSDLGSDLGSVSVLKLNYLPWSLNIFKLALLQCALSGLFFVSSNIGFWIVNGTTKYKHI
jgi:hypothetical protein